MIGIWRYVSIEATCLDNMTGVDIYLYDSLRDSSHLQLATLIRIGDLKI